MRALCLRTTVPLVRAAAATARSRALHCTAMAGGGSQYPAPQVAEALNGNANACLIMLHGLGERPIISRSPDGCSPSPRRRCRCRRPCDPSH